MEFCILLVNENVFCFFKSVTLDLMPNCSYIKFFKAEPKKQNLYGHYLAKYVLSYFWTRLLFFFKSVTFF